MKLHTINLYFRCNYALPIKKYVKLQANDSNIHILKAYIYTTSVWVIFNLIEI